MINIAHLLDSEPIEDCYKDSNFFNPDFLPKKIKHRDNEINTLVNYMKPILHDKKPKNSLILGNSGVGKTTIMKSLFNSIERKSNDTYCCYVSCQFHTNIREVYLNIYEHITAKKLINPSKTPSILFNNIFDYLSDENKNILICIDDINNYFKKKDINQLFNQLLRHHINEKHSKVIVGLFPIITNDNFRFQLDNSVLSVFPHTEVRFKDYTNNQMFSILKERCDHGFCKKVITDEQIRIVSNYCYVFSDLRAGLELLTNLGNMVNITNDCKVRNDHVDHVIDEHRLCVLSK